MKYDPYLLLSLFLWSYAPSYSQSKPDSNQVVAGVPVNYKEALVGDYSLPDPLMRQNGNPVTDQKTWIEIRRPEILRLFETYQFGRIPAVKPVWSFKIREKNGIALEGKAIRRQVTLYFTKDTTDHKIDLLIYLPAGLKPVPVMLQLSFVTNAMAVKDPAVKKSMAWIREEKVLQSSTRFRKIEVEKFMNAGIGFATVYYGDIEPDFKEGIHYGIRSPYIKKDATRRDPDAWGAIAAWSWGLSRIMDYFVTDPDIDEKRIALNGASRLGKTVLWTGARDPRFALLIPSISGEGGAALSRRNYGETIKMITDTHRYFYQFAPRYHSFSDRVEDLPMDSHMLLALIAPRPLLLQTGDQDYFSDPKGAFLALKAAEPVYRLFGKKGPGSAAWPAAGDTSLLHPLGYYMHAGGHTILPEDYDIFIQFMKKYL